MTAAIGKTQTIRDVLDPARAAALHATLGRAGTAPGAGDPLPPFWHHIHFWEPAPPAALGHDGHPATGQGLIPDLGLPARMWAGGALVFHAPLILGAPATRTTTVEDVALKKGRSGPLGFVTLRHHLMQDGVLCIDERQDLVYRPMPGDRPAPPEPPRVPADHAATGPLRFDATLLFRYSALTFNGHRIHYDLDHARGTEGYGGLVVHGPLLAQLLIHLAQERLGTLRRFRFAARAPLVHTETATLHRDDGHLWVRAEDGRLCMEAWAE